MHVLGMPPAFALSQDQTLRFITHPDASPKENTPDRLTLQAHQTRNSLHTPKGQHARQRHNTTRPPTREPSSSAARASHPAARSTAHPWTMKHAARQHPEPQAKTRDNRTKPSEHHATPCQAQNSPAQGTHALPRSDANVKEHALASQPRAVKAPNQPNPTHKGKGTKPTAFAGQPT